MGNLLIYFSWSGKHNFDKLILLCIFLYGHYSSNLRKNNCFLKIYWLWRTKTYNAGNLGWNDRWNCSPDADLSHYDHQVWLGWGGETAETALISHCLLWFSYCSWFQVRRLSNLQAKNASARMERLATSSKPWSKDRGSDLEVDITMD